MRRSWVGSLIVLGCFVCAGLSGTMAHAEFDLRSETTNTIFNSTLLNKTTGESTQSDFLGLDVRNKIYFSRQLFPFFTFRTGGVFNFDLGDSTTEGVWSESLETLLRPFAEVNYNNPIYQAGFGYTLTQSYSELTGVEDIDGSMNEWNANLGFTPVDLPQLNFRYYQTNLRESPDEIDTVERRVTADFDYMPWRDLQINYLYSLNAFQDRLSENGSTEQNHNGRVEFSKQFFDNRLRISTAYSGRYMSLDLPPGGAGQPIPLMRVGGYFSLTTSPGTGEVGTVVPGLIDGDVVTPTGINIGLDGDPLATTNIALDLGTNTNVDLIYLWVDTPLPVTVSNYFAWSVYASPDNTPASTWTLVATVFPATFGPLRSRFEIPFPGKNTRFIKVVTRALNLSVPEAANFPNIFVTEMQAFSSLSPGPGEDTITDFTQNFYFDVLGRVTKKTSLGYNFFLNLEDQSFPDQQSREISHGALVTHNFNEMFSLSANATRIETKEEDENIIFYGYSTVLKATYLPTFTQSLVYSGSLEDSDQHEDYLTNSAIVRNTLEVYRNWSLFLDLGYAWGQGIEGETENNIIMRAGSEVIPNPKVTITANYNGSVSLGDNPMRDSPTQQQFDLQALVTPYNNLSFFARLGIVEEMGPLQILQNYNANWSPFPGGDIQLLFAYSEVLGSGELPNERSFGPGIKWTIGQYMYVEGYYNRVRSDTQLTLVESNSVTTRFRLRF